MGVLEEAIREHLDLKRKHGASDAELNRQEAEALGPARREAPESEGAEAPAEHAEAVDVPEAEAPVEEESIEAPVAPGESDDPDFGGEAREQKPPRDFDFD